MRDALNRARKKDREALAEDLRAVYRAETKAEGKEALQKLHERWGTAYPRIVARWETKAYAFLAFLPHPRPIRRYLYTTNQLERLTKEVKRRAKVVEVFCGEEALVETFVLGAPQPKRARGRTSTPRLAEVLMESYHEAQTP